MFERSLPLSIVLTIFAAAAGCSSASSAEIDGCTEGVPLVTSSSKSGALELSVCTSSQPPIHGEMKGRITVTDAKTHARVDGLTLAVTPWMPAMGHGQSLALSITPQGNGEYEVAPLALYMAGEWELDTTISGPMHDSANPAFDVP